MNMKNGYQRRDEMTNVEILEKLKKQINDNMEDVNNMWYNNTRPYERNKARKECIQLIDNMLDELYAVKYTIEQSNYNYYYNIRGDM